MFSHIFESVNTQSHLNLDSGIKSSSTKIGECIEQTVTKPLVGLGLSYLSGQAGYRIAEKTNTFGTSA